MKVTLGMLLTDSSRFNTVRGLHGESREVT